MSHAFRSLELIGLTFAPAGRTIVDRLSCRIEAGTRTVVLGPNGAGKSVLMRLCHGLLAPTGGRIVWNDDPDGAPLRQGMVFQRPVMLRRSAAANVAYGLALAGVARRERDERVADALARVGLTHVGARPARILSGGEQQRLALARAWALAPDVLFLDEPTASLDPTAAREVEAIIDAIHGAGTKVVMTTHNLGQARRLGDDILFIHEGRLAERAAAGAFFSRPASPEAAAFLDGELPWH